MSGNTSLKDLMFTLNGMFGDCQTLAPGIFLHLNASRVLWKELNSLHNRVCLMDAGVRREISQEPDHEDGKKPLGESS